MTKYIQTSFFDNKVLPLLSFLYTDTMYGKNFDYYRIKDILDQYDPKQIECKQWVVDELLPFINKEDEIAVIGGWYGLMSHMLAECLDNTIMDYELDAICIELHYRLKVHDSVMIELKDGFEIFDDKDLNGKDKVIICTACEHIDEEDLYGALSMKNPHSLIVLQSNNMSHIDSHVNCHPSLDCFIESLPDMEILYKGTKVFDDYERYMVIAK